jgi:hypothetical protein
MYPKEVVSMALGIEKALVLVLAFVNTVINHWVSQNGG